MCDLMEVIYERFTYPYMLYAFVNSRRVTLMHTFNLTRENVAHVRLKNILSYLLIVSAAMT